MDDRARFEAFAGLATEQRVLTAEEHAAGAKRMFLEMDANHDGFVTLEELSAGHARMMKKPAS